MGMKYLAAYLMCVIGGKESPSAADVTAVLEAGGIEIDQALLKLTMDRAAGKQVHELIAEGSKKFAACGGGGGGGGAAPAAGGAAAGGDAPAAGGKKEEKKAAVEEEEEDMDFDLFG
eukprot:SRR837773.26615.p2 GENE.SRR837773.26615~~SRR837773.26615.p2  ORF type:complete len:133 (-),score=51.08 SRR837773.26615:41-391(-)